MYQSADIKEGEELAVQMMDVLMDGYYSWCRSLGLTPSTDLLREYLRGLTR